MNNPPDGTVDFTDPLGDLVDVSHGGRKGDELDVPGAIDDDFFPHRPPSLISHVVALVQHHVGGLLQRTGVELVAENLGGHDRQGGTRVYFDIPRKDPHVLFPELLTKIGKLLIAEGLEGSGVGKAPPRGERLINGELGDEGLPGSRGGTSQNLLPGNGDILSPMLERGIFGVIRRKEARFPASSL
jgi:hypothetical protein